MPTILSISELRESLTTTYSLQVLKESKLKRQANIDAFLALNRSGLANGESEKRLLLYTTLSDEKIYVQYPGSEAARVSTPMPKDFRPEFQFSDGSFLSGATFGWIWDILAGIGQRHHNYLDITATLIFHLGYMTGHTFIHDKATCSLIDIPTNTESAEEDLELDWYSFMLSNDVWHSLNNYIGDIVLSEGKSISLEGFVKFFDLLLQNEDCKYYYRNVMQNSKENYNLENGRTATCDANLLIISYLQGSTKLSALLNSFQKSRGIPSFKKGDYPVVTGGLVVSSK